MSTSRSAGSIPSPPLPRKIGRYVVVERIGRGAMGVVYSARDEIMDRVVALKVMAGDLESEPDTRERFLREAKVGGQILHRNLTTVFDLGECDGRMFIVMELLRGEPLGRFLARPEGVSLEAKVDLMIQLCEGLSAAHAQGVFHRDIKPSNLYVLTDGTLKILDFGIARLASSTMTASGLVVGTPDYMSPEQTVGRGVDHRSDVFSAGAVFYFMLTGRKPFASPDLPAILRKVQHADPPPVSSDEAPSGLVRIVMQMLAKRREDRPQSAREVVAALVHFQRVWDSETKSIAAVAHRGCLEIDALRKEGIRTAELLGIGPELSPDPILSALQEEYPLLCDQGADGILRIPFKRDVILSIVNRIEGRRNELVAQLTPLRAAADAVREAEDTVRNGRAAPVSPSLIDAARAVPQSELVSAALRKAREHQERLDAAASRVRELQHAAAAARAEQQWARVLDVAEQLSLLDGSASEAAALKAEANSEIDRELSRRVQAMRVCLTASKEALAHDRLDEAEEQARRAGEIEQTLNSESGAAEVASLQRSIATARLAAARIAEAQTLFESGQRVEAIEALRAFQREQPDSRGIDEAIRRLKSEAERLARIERRHADAQAHLAAAQQASADGDLKRARDEAAAAVAVEPSIEGALELLVDARVKLRRTADYDASVSRALDALAQGRTLIKQNRFAQAAALAETAMGIEATLDEARNLVFDALRLESAQRVETFRKRTDRDRRRAAEQKVQLVRAALSVEDWNQAVLDAETILAWDENHAEARTLLAHALQRVPLTGDVPEVISHDRPDLPESDGDSGVTQISDRGPATWKNRLIGGIQSRLGPLLDRARGGQGPAA